MSRDTGNWVRTTPYDMLCKPIDVGDKVVRAFSSGRAVNIEIVEVTKIEEDKIYLNNSKVPVNFPGRLLVVNNLFEEVTCDGK